MEKLLLVDGHSILNRAYYGVPHLTNSKGLHTNAIYGFLNILFKVLDDEKPDYIMVAFDLSAPTFRHKIFDAYKGTRKPMDDELRQQVPVMKEVLKSMGIVLMEKEGYEADDILGTMSKRAEADGLDVCILSGDRDLLQLASDKIKIKLPHTVKGKTTVEDMYAKDVLEKYQVSPAGIIELKALMGDSSDNIPGVPRVGEKTATELVVKYGNIENLKEHLDEITKKALHQTLVDNFEMAEMSKILATINVEAPIDYDYKQSKNENLYTKEAYEFFKELEFKNLLNRFDDTTNASKRNTIEITKISEAKSVFDNAKVADKSAFIIDIINNDILSGNNNLTPLELMMMGDTLPKRSIKSISIVLDDKNIYLIKCDGCKDLLIDYIKTANGKVFTLNLKDELFVLEIELVKNLHDISILSYVIDPTRGKYEYDIEQIYDQGDKFLEEIDSLGCKDLYFEIEQPLTYTLYRMENEGILIKPKNLFEYGQSLSVRIDELKKSICEQAGEEFNINSPKQLGQILFEKMGIEGGKKTSTGAYSTSAEVLEELSISVPFVKDVLEYRTLSKLKSTYADGLSAFIDHENKIHTSFQQTVTATGRLSSTDPNLQNIPIRMELGRSIRKVFVPHEGNVFIDADYSQIELRLLAHMSGDKDMIGDFNSGKDIHAATASKVFGVDFDMVTPLQRRNAKAVNFGIVYGISAFGLAKDIGISRKEASEFIESYFETYKEIHSFLDGLKNSAKENGYSVTMYGRRRPIPELKEKRTMQFGERVAMNAPIQGSAADIMKIAMINVERALKDAGLSAKMLLQVHDEILIEAPAIEEEQVKKILKDEMEGAAKLLVPLVADIHTGLNWYDAK